MCVVDGVPVDGIPYNVVVTIVPLITGIFVTMATIGIGLTLIGIFIYYVLRNKV